MRLIIILLLLGSRAALSQDETSKKLIGSWSIEEEGIITHLIVAEGYFSISEYTTTEFLRTYGGSWDINASGWLVLGMEFDSKNPDMVKKIVNKPFEIVDENLTLDKKVWKRVDDGSPGQLGGAWYISARMRNGEMRERKLGSRITMKILSGARFQWIAYNIDTTEFLGTGGGTYTSEDGVYTENIEFFSRNQDRVGASLKFKFDLKDGNWHHSGKSSKGTDIYEVWSLR